MKININMYYMIQIHIEIRQDKKEVFPNDFEMI